MLEIIQEEFKRLTEYKKGSVIRRRVYEFKCSILFYCLTSLYERSRNRSGGYMEDQKLYKLVKEDTYGVTDYKLSNQG